MDLHGGHHWIMGEHFRLFTTERLNGFFNTRLKDYFLSFKENDFHAEITEDNNVLLKINDYVADNLLNHKIWFDIIEFDNGFLNISGLFNSLYNIKNISIEAIPPTDDVKDIQELFKDLNELVVAIKSADIKFVAIGAFLMLLV